MIVVDCRTAYTVYASGSLIIVVFSFSTFTKGTSGLFEELSQVLVVAIYKPIQG
ncbi:MAG: hypothetical protein LBH62_08810 [Nitrososphaerota archaeon]|nr:hypothetical protein [Nitrososphaerota archaeon]